ncbi:DUF1697 domain-containing protein [Pseudoxanthomonas winnipegensis]|uniref:DUF1697 domain-containing protein n=1 Tax=Pseudoxanthomonas winnipegensis TaxID=2480810 RepID=A0A4Q8LKD3_9GAMM|nr:DUF1697 domain-containing protein [Pseudoxanthomonas winnipegensis]RZZ85130.1 DUF1697 domain-containing protein [Pseudoxanthomonas winnipegensis]TAA30955.1 DUF1697 domain-containing protein [Pseudoxanthomonas winnipegensis]TAA38690.1 DUF1697 domain-containing protein [Pseudoxanthomonas winnipegensis]TBV77722.1 DUF1697 domain-containing protein [Pseudoxanthomonas winnipegensis]
MSRYIALLRAVNVGGTGKLPMAELRSMCEAIGCTEVRTYIASGNVVFASRLAKAVVKHKLEAALEAYAGKPVGVAIRTGAEMAAVLAANPFASAAPNRTVAIFLDGPPPADTVERVSGLRNEDIALGANEIYVHYRDGMADSKLKIAAAKAGTARNMNTVATLAEWAAE